MRRESTITTTFARNARKGDLIKTHDGMTYKVKKITGSTVLTVVPYRGWVSPAIAFTAGLVTGFLLSFLVGQLW